MKEEKIEGLTINYYPSGLTPEGNALTESQRLDLVLGQMEVNSHSLSNEIEEKEEKLYFRDLEKVVVSKVGTDFVTNQPIYEVAVQKRSLRDFLQLNLGTNFFETRTNITNLRSLQHKLRSSYAHFL
jgi:hypothetical protein